jgi:hypothetical protein
MFEENIDVDGSSNSSIKDICDPIYPTCIVSQQSFSWIRIARNDVGGKDNELLFFISRKKKTRVVT